MIIIFLGGPGSGKSTLGNRLAEELKWPWISTGEILGESEEPWVVEKLKTAQLFSEEMVSGLLFSRLEGVDNAVIDGYPRTLPKAEILVERNLKVDLLIELDVSLEEAKKRLSLRGRNQDIDDVIDERFADYEENKAKIQAFLVGNGTKFLNVDGIGTPDEVYNRVSNILKNEIHE